MMDKVKYHLDKAQECNKARKDSIQRCDEDGFVTQLVNQNLVFEHQLEADLAGKNNKAQFVGLYEGQRRVKAKIIDTRFGKCWILDLDETSLIAKAGSKFISVGAKSRKQKQLGLSELNEVDNAEVGSQSTNPEVKGLAGLYFIQRCFIRTGCEWGTEAKLIS